MIKEPKNNLALTKRNDHMKVKYIFQIDSMINHYGLSKRKLLTLNLGISLKVDSLHLQFLDTLNRESLISRFSRIEPFQSQNKVLKV